MPTRPRYHIHLNAYLPTGPLAPDGQPTYVLHEGPKELEYMGEPNLAWVPLNDLAVEAQAKLLDKVVAALEETIKFVDPKSRSMPQHVLKINQLKAQRKNLKVGDAPGSALDEELQPQTLGDAQKGIASGVQLKRPSDRPDRR